MDALTLPNVIYRSFIPLPILLQYKFLPICHSTFFFFFVHMYVYQHIRMFKHLHMAAILIFEVLNIFARLQTIFYILV